MTPFLRVGERTFLVCCQKSSEQANSSRLAKLTLTVHFARPVIRASVELAHVDRHCRRSDGPKHRNTDCACPRSISIKRRASARAPGLPSPRKSPSLIEQPFHQKVSSCCKSLAGGSVLRPRPDRKLVPVPIDCQFERCRLGARPVAGFSCSRTASLSAQYRR